MSRDLIQRVEAAMQSDTESSTKQSAYLQSVYIDANDRTKKALDEAFTALCGYTLATLIALDPTEEDDEIEEDEPHRFRNFYKCDGGDDDAPHARNEWDSTWSCKCDDECSECGASLTPYKSEDI